MKVKHLLYTLLFVLLAAGCQSKSDQLLKSEETINMHVAYAKHFSLERAKGATHVHLLNPETGEIDQTITVADTAQLPQIVALSSTHIGMLKQLDQLAHILGVSSFKYVNNEELLKRIEHKEVFEFGEESNVPLEQIIAAHPDYITYSGFGKKFSHEKQLVRLGITPFPIYDWRETHPLGRLEWIKVFGIMYHKEKEAWAYFESVSQAYNELVKKAHTLEEAPCILSGNIFGDYWYCPAGDSYQAVLFRDAHVQYPYQETSKTGSLSLSLETVLMENQQCGVWVNPGAHSLQDLTSRNPKAIYFEAYKTNNVYCYTPLGNAFWENSGTEPHHLLSDLIKITHPEVDFIDSLYFYARLK